MAVSHRGRADTSATWRGGRGAPEDLDTFALSAPGRLAGGLGDFGTGADAEGAIHFAAGLEEQSGPTSNS